MGFAGRDVVEQAVSVSETTTLAMMTMRRVTDFPSLMGRSFSRPQASFYSNMRAI